MCPVGFGPLSSEPLASVPANKSALKDRKKISDDLRDAVDLLLRSQADQALMTARLIQIVQLFVRERTDNAPIDNKDLEEHWNALAALFKSHADAIREETERETKDGGAAPRK